MQLVEKYVVPAQEAAGNVDAREILKKVSFQLQPITDVHLTSAGVHDRLTHGLSSCLAIAFWRRKVIAKHALKVISDLPDHILLHPDT